MKYEGTRPSGKDKDIPVYIFSVGKDEMEIMAKVLAKTYEHTPDVVEITSYRGRLRNLTKVFGQIFIEEVKGKKLPTKRTHVTHRKIRERLHP